MHNTKGSAYRSISASISLSRLASLYPDLQQPLQQLWGQVQQQWIALGRSHHHSQLGLLHRQLLYPEVYPQKPQEGTNQSPGTIRRFEAAGVSWNLSMLLQLAATSLFWSIWLEDPETACCGDWETAYPTLLPANSFSILSIQQGISWC